MSHRLEIRPEAAWEFKEAAAWYEAQRAGLGVEFIAAVDRTMDAVASTPSRFPDVHDGTRRALVRRFPYGVFFRIADENIIVLAVIHLHRDPERWRRR